MKIVCTVCVANRQLSTLGSNKPTKHVKSTLALCKHPNANEYCLLLFTNQNKTGTKYNVNRNVRQILTRFINEGKCTIQFAQPEHDLYINGDVIQLKSFLHLLRRVLENKVSPKELSVSSMAVTPVRIKDMAPIKLTIRNRSEYPIKGFPRTLQELHINDIKRSGVDRGILQLTGLRILDLSHNCIETIPDELSRLPTLNELNVSNNSLGRSSNKNWNWMGGCLSKTLLLLDVSHNELTEVPNQIGKLHGLTTLNLSNNSLKTLPPGVGNLRNLKVFSASNNSISILPGSMKKLRLQSIDLSNNAFAQCVPEATTSKPLPVCTLKEYCARKALGARIPYPPGSLPSTVINYLDSAKFCVCGKACFDVFFRSFQNLLLAHIAEAVSTSLGEIMYVPIDCFFCSQKCYSFSFQHRTRNPIVR